MSQKDWNYHGHGTGVSNTQLDYNMVFLVVVLISWAVRMRNVKSIEGQCWTHKTNCSDTRKMHSEIYDQWIEVGDIKGTKGG
jgi:hypothetical protein